MSGMEWFNEPARWSSSDDLVIHADPGSDFWRTTHYGFVRDNGHIYGSWFAGDCTVTATFSGEFSAQYDQAGIALRISPSQWIKAGVELVDGQFQASAVVTRDFSDWSVVAIPRFERMTVSAERAGDTVTISYAVEDASPRMLRQAYFPPDVPALVGAMCAAPDGPGFVTRFHALNTFGAKLSPDGSSPKRGAWPE